MTNIERVAEKAILNVIAFFYKPFRKIIPPTFFRYGFSGGANMVFDWILYFVFYNFVFQKEIVDLGFIAFTPHIAAFIFKFPITLLTGFGSIGISVFRVLLYVGVFSCFGIF